MGDEAKSNSTALETADTLDALERAISQRELLLGELRLDPRAAAASLAAGARALDRLRLLCDQARIEVEQAARLRDGLQLLSPKDDCFIDTRG